MTQLNETQTRCITEAACGIACYEGAVTDGKFVGTHAGACRDWDDAEEWLRGGTPKSLIRVYPLEPISE